MSTSIKSAAKNSKESAPSDRPAWHHRFSQSSLPYLLLVLTLVFFALIRLRLLNIPLERDEGEFAYSGQLLLQGIAPYKFAYTMKLPGTAAVYAAILVVFGQSPGGIHAGLLAVNVLTMLLVFFLTRKFLSAYAGTVAAATYGLLSTSPSVLGFAAHATHLVVLFAISGLLVLTKALRSQRHASYFFSGLLLGLAFLMKQPGIFFVAFAAIYALRSELQARRSWREIATRLSLLLCGSALPVALTCLLMWHAGVFRTFWFWTFTYAQQYGRIVSPKDSPFLFFPAARAVIQPAIFLWLIAAFGCIAFFWSKEHRKNLFFALAFLLFSFLSVCSGFYFRSHYFILLLPAISFLVAAAVVIAGQCLRRHRFLRFLPALAFLLACLFSIAQQRRFLFAMDPLAACRSLYGLNPFPEARTIARFLQSHTQPFERIAVLGAEPEIFFYAQRNSATGFIYSYPLLEEQPLGLSMQETFISEIESAQPPFVVLVPISWGRMHPHSPTLALDWTHNYLENNYQLIKSVKVPEEPGEGVPGVAPSVPYTIQIFQRK
jgi:hypothetical protein